jgi:hypothetical protein
LFAPTGRRDDCRPVFPAHHSSAYRPAMPGAVRWRDSEMRHGVSWIALPEPSPTHAHRRVGYSQCGETRRRRRSHSVGRQPRDVQTPRYWFHVKGRRIAVAGETLLTDEEHASGSSVPEHASSQMAIRSQFAGFRRDCGTRSGAPMQIATRPASTERHRLRSVAPSSPREVPRSRGQRQRVGAAPC